MFKRCTLHNQNLRQIIQLRDFRLQLIREIIETYGYSKVSKGRSSAGENPIRIIGRHFPSLADINALNVTLDFVFQIVLEISIR